MLQNPQLHYLDNAATTPVRREAVEAAVQAMTEGWGNPSSRYASGTAAAAAVKALEQLPIWYIVSWFAFSFFSTSAYPNPSARTTFPSFTIPTEIEG